MNAWRQASLDLAWPLTGSVVLWILTSIVAAVSDGWPKDVAIGLAGGVTAGAVVALLQRLQSHRQWVGAFGHWGGRWRQFNRETGVGIVDQSGALYVEVAIESGRQMVLRGKGHTVHGKEGAWEARLGADPRQPGFAEGSFAYTNRLPDVAGRMRVYEMWDGSLLVRGEPEGVTDSSHWTYRLEPAPASQGGGLAVP